MIFHWSTSSWFTKKTPSKKFMLLQPSEIQRIRVSRSPCFHKLMHASTNIMCQEACVSTNCCVDQTHHVSTNSCFNKLFQRTLQRSQCFNNRIRASAHPKGTEVACKTHNAKPTIDKTRHLRNPEDASETMQMHSRKTQALQNKTINCRPKIPLSSFGWFKQLHGHPKEHLESYYHFGPILPF